MHHGAFAVPVQTAPTAPHSLREWCVVHSNMVIAMSEIDVIRPKRQKTGGRQMGTPNRVTADIRQALRDLAEGNADRVQEWLDRVAETDPGEALRLWLALLRFVTPTLQAATIADVTRSTSKQAQLSAMTDQELTAALLSDPEELAAYIRMSQPQLSCDLEPSPVRALIGVDDPLLR